jgi:hypothetical protein
LALCWPCLVCFHALPYGCHLTGGPSTALHSWDERLLRQAVARRVRGNERHLALGRPLPPAGPYPAEVQALRELRDYHDVLVDGVELLVFSNDNRGAVFRSHAVDQPLAEWLRQTVRQPQRRAGFTALIRAHRGDELPGAARLARYAFLNPARILTTAVNYVDGQVERSAVPPLMVADLAVLVFSYAIEVLCMREKDIEQVRMLAANIAVVVATDGDASRFKKYRIAHRDRRLHGWLERQAVAWALAPPSGADGPFVTGEQFRLLFEPGGQGWFHQQLLLVAVLEQLHVLGWRPDDAGQVADELADDETAGNELDEEFEGVSA